MTEKSIHYYGNPAAETVLVQMVDDHDLSVMEQEVGTIRTLTDGADFLLAAVMADNWNIDLSPWPTEPVFGDERFGAGAPQTLAWLTKELIPRISGVTERDRVFYIGGYSLSGLFALWASCQSDLFRGVAAVSPSVWFPGFRDYLRENPPRAGQIYLSLGTREERTRNPLMSQVGDAIREIDQFLQEHDYRCTLEWNPGNHFREPDRRTARGFAWLMTQ